MKTVLTGKPLVLILFYFTGLKAYAQFNITRLELGADATTFIYQGDLTPSKPGSFKTMTLGLGIYGNYKLNKVFSLKTNFVFGKLRGDEARYSLPAYRQERNFKFTSPVTEVSESIVWNLLPTGNNGGPKLTSYISAGIGFAFFRIRRDFSNYNAAYFFNESGSGAGLSVDTAHNLPKGIIVFPVSAGLQYSLTKYLSLNLTTT